MASPRYGLFPDQVGPDSRRRNVLADRRLLAAPRAVHARERVHVGLGLDERVHGERGSVPPRVSGSELSEAGLRGVVSERGRVVLVLVEVIALGMDAQAVSGRDLDLRAQRGVARRRRDVYRASLAGFRKDVAAAVEELARHVAADAVPAERRHRITAKRGLTPSLCPGREPAPAAGARDDMHDAREALAPPTDGGPPAYDLDPFDHLHGDLAPADPAEVRVVQRYAIDEHQRAAGGRPSQSPQGDGLPGGVRDPRLEWEAKVEARNFLEYILQRLSGRETQFLSSHDRHVDGHLSHRRR